jgi:hypothetical protein
VRDLNSIDNKIVVKVYKDGVLFENSNISAIENSFSSDGVELIEDITLNTIGMIGEYSVVVELYSSNTMIYTDSKKMNLYQSGVCNSDYLDSGLMDYNQTFFTTYLNSSNMSMCSDTDSTDGVYKLTNSDTSYLATCDNGYTNILDIQNATQSPFLNNKFVSESDFSTNIITYPKGMYEVSIEYSDTNLSGYINNDEFEKAYVDNKSYYMPLIDNNSTSVTISKDSGCGYSYSLVVEKDGVSSNICSNYNVKIKPITLENIVATVNGSISLEAIKGNKVDVDYTALNTQLSDMVKDVDTNSSIKSLDVIDSFDVELEVLDSDSNILDDAVVYNKIQTKSLDINLSNSYIDTTSLDAGNYTLLAKMSANGSILKTQMVSFSVKNQSSIVVDESGNPILNPIDTTQPVYGIGDDIDIVDAGEDIVVDIEPIKEVLNDLADSLESPEFEGCQQHFNDIYLNARLEFSCQTCDTDIIGDPIGSPGYQDGGCTGCPKGGFEQHITIDDPNDPDNGGSFKEKFRRAIDKLVPPKYNTGLTPGGEYTLITDVTNSRGKVIATNKTKFKVTDKNIFIENPHDFKDGKVAKITPPSFGGGGLSNNFSPNPSNGGGSYIWTPKVDPKIKRYHKVIRNIVGRLVDKGITIQLPNQPTPVPIAECHKYFNRYFGSIDIASNCEGVINESLEFDIGSLEEFEKIVFGELYSRECECESTIVIGTGDINIGIIGINNPPNSTLPEPTDPNPPVTTPLDPINDTSECVICHRDKDDNWFNDNWGHHDSQDPNRLIGIGYPNLRDLIIKNPTLDPGELFDGLKQCVICHRDRGGDYEWYLGGRDHHTINPNPVYDCVDDLIGKNPILIGIDIGGNDVCKDPLFYMQAKKVQDYLNGIEIKNPYNLSRQIKNTENKIPLDGEIYNGEILDVNFTQNFKQSIKDLFAEFATVEPFSDCGIDDYIEISSAILVEREDENGTKYYSEVTESDTLFAMDYKYHSFTYNQRLRSTQADSIKNHGLDTTFLKEGKYKLVTKVVTLYNNKALFTKETPFSVKKYHLPLSCKDAYDRYGYNTHTGEKEILIYDPDGADEYPSRYAKCDFKNGGWTWIIHPDDSDSKQDAENWVDYVKNLDKDHDNSWLVKSNVYDNKSVGWGDEPWKGLYIDAGDWYHRNWTRITLPHTAIYGTMTGWTGRRWNMGSAGVCLQDKKEDGKRSYMVSSDIGFGSGPAVIFYNDAWNGRNTWTFQIVTNFSYQTINGNSTYTDIITNIENTKNYYQKSMYSVNIYIANNTVPIFLKEFRVK